MSVSNKQMTNNTRPADVDALAGILSVLAITIIFCFIFHWIFLS